MYCVVQTSAYGLSRVIRSALVVCLFNCNNACTHAHTQNNDAATEEERARLEPHGEYHLGEFVNRFRRGSLVMQPAQVMFAIIFYHILGNEGPAYTSP